MPKTRLHVQTKMVDFLFVLDWNVLGAFRWILGSSTSVAICIPVQYTKLNPTVHWR